MLTKTCSFHYNSNCVCYHVHAFIDTVSYRSLYMNQVAEKTMYWSMIMTTYIDNIRVHCRKIYNLVEPTLETGRKTRFYVLFRSQCIWILYVPTTYVYCVYPAMWKNFKPTAKLSKKGRNNRRSHRSWWCFLWSPRLYCYRFLLLFNMKQVPEKIYLS